MLQAVSQRVTEQADHPVFHLRPRTLADPILFFSCLIISHHSCCFTPEFSQGCLYLPSCPIATAKFRPLSVSCSSVLLSLASLLPGSLFHCYQKYSSKIGLKGSLSCLKTSGGWTFSPSCTVEDRFPLTQPTFHAMSPPPPSFVQCISVTGPSCPSVAVTSVQPILGIW